MKLKSIGITGFGKLRNYNIDLNDNLTVLLEENGWGKSTLSTFIRVMFFGFEGETKRGDIYLKERLRYMPWLGGQYGGNIVFEAGGKEYQLVRSFGKDARSDTFHLYDNITKLECNDYHDPVGEELFGLNVEGFEKTIYFGQNALETGVNNSINALLGNVEGSLDDIGRLNGALAALDQKIRSLSPDTKKGKLYQLKDEVTALNNDLRTASGVEGQIAFTSANLTNLKKELAENRKMVTSLEEELKKASVKEMLFAKKEELDRIRARLKEREDRFESVTAGLPSAIEEAEDIEKYGKLAKTYEVKEKEYSDIAAKRMTAAGRKKYILLFAGLVLIAICIPMLLHRALLIGIACGIVGIILAVLGLTVRKTDAELTAMADELASMKKSLDDYLSPYDKLFNENQDYTDRLFVLENAKDRFSESHEELVLARNDVKDFVSENGNVDAEKLREYEGIKSVEDINVLLVHYRNKTDELSAKIDTCDSQLTALLERKDELDEEFALRDEKKEEYNSCKKKYKFAAYARKYLEEAGTSFTAKYSVPVEEGFKKYYKLLAEDDSDKYSFDANASLVIEDEGDRRDLRCYSAGNKDKISICYRMGLIDAMYSEEKPFLIMDDPLTNLDAPRLGKSREMLKKLSKEYQIIYLTCHDSRVV